jgi:hypothetical protein
MQRPRLSARSGPGRGRPALTLMETLVAIFIMAIGMLALLTLFPLGALRMEQAIKDERTAQAAVQAIEFAKMLDLANDPMVRYALTDPNAPVSGGYSPGSGAVAGPSKAVLVDPLGDTNPQNTDPTKILYVDTATGNLARIGSSYWNNYYEFFTLTDDIVFKVGTGIPRQFGNSIGRETRFSWSYLLQQPQVQNPGITNYTVCIYNRRPLAGSLDWVLPKAQLNLTNNTISFDASDPTVVRQILPGQWVLDATLAKGISASTIGGPATTVPMANFYRIINVRYTGNGITLDLQTPIRGYSAITPTPNVYPSIPGGNATTPAAVCIIQESLVEVVDIGPLR